MPVPEEIYGIINQTRRSIYQNFSIHQVTLFASTIHTDEVMRKLDALKQSGSFSVDASEDK